MKKRIVVQRIKGSVVGAALTMAVLLGVHCNLIDPPTEPEPQQTLNPADWEITSQAAALGRGINLGNALDAPSEGEWGVTLKEEYFSHIKQLGFESVRIPVRWSAHCLKDAPYTIDEAFFERVEWAVDRALENGLRTIINIHHYEDLMADPQGQRSRFIAIWEQIAKRFGGYGPELYFELCNEPMDKLTPALWNDYAREALGAVRVKNPYRSVIIGPTSWNHFDGLPELTLPADSFLIVELHYYSPDMFTHQGAPWMTGSGAWVGTKWRATRSDTALVINHFNRIDAWATEHNVPVHLGEFGAFDTADMLLRALYTSFIARQAAARKWSSAYWKYNADFGIYNDSTGETRSCLVDALLRPESTFDSCLQIALADTQAIGPGSAQFVVLDDFDDTLGQQNSLAPLFMARNGMPAESSFCWWTAWYDDSSSVNDTQGTRILTFDEADTAGLASNFNLLIGEGGKEGRGLHLRGVLRGDAYPYLGIGTECPGWYDSVWFDFSELTAITFWAKGYGEMRVNFTTDTVLNGYGPEDNWGNFGCDFSLEPQWKQYIIPVKNLKPKAYSEAASDKLTWSDGMKKVCYIDFQSNQSYGKTVNDSIEMYLDDIRLYGMSEESFGLGASGR
jgi:endoglucanase